LVELIGMHHRAQELPERCDIGVLAAERLRLTANALASRAHVSVERRDKTT
jgi:hypothetical protein